MRSCLYECKVSHRRLEPRTHGFEYRVFLLALDLDELAECDRRLRLFSADRPNLYSIRERDYLPTGEALHNPSKVERIVPNALSDGAHGKRNETDALHPPNSSQALDPHPPVSAGDGQPPPPPSNFPHYSDPR